MVAGKKSMLGLKKYFRNKFKKVDKKEFLSLFLFFLFLGYLLWFLFDTHILQKDVYGNLLTGESTYGDLPFHLSTITQIAFGKIFPPEHPLYAGIPLVYPYLINLLSAGLVMLGMSLRYSIIFPGILLSLLTAALLYYFYKKISKDYKTALVATFLFWFNGGLGFYYFYRDILKKGLFNEFIKDPGRFSDYSHLFTENIHWNNFLSRIVVPERAVLLGIPAGLVILYLLFVKSKGKKFRFDRNFFVAAVLTGLLPFLHTHTFLSFFLIIPFLALFELKKEELRKWFKKWIIFAAVVLIVSSPWLISILSHIDQGGFIRSHIGWMAKPGVKNFFVFWFKNAGILIPIMIVVMFAKFPNKLTKRFTYTGLFVLVMVNLFLFQPFDWDNIKLLFWVGVFGALSAAIFLSYISRKWGAKGKLLSLILFMGLTLSSFISLYREIKLQHVLFSKEEVSLGEWVREETARDSLFLTAPIHNSFASSLAGRRIFMGYQGLLWTQGIDYSQRELGLKRIYKGHEKADLLLEKNNIDYVVIGGREKADLKADTAFFEKNYCLVKESATYNIFAISNCDK